MRILLILLLLSTSLGGITRKVTYDQENQYTFYVIHNPESVEIKKDIEYYWYEDRKIHKSRGAYSGELLHGIYEHQTRNFDLKENGRFFLGQKDSIWNTYNNQGELVTRVEYNKGVLHGDYMTFKNNEPSITGTYKKGKKKGKWIDHIKKDTLYYYGDLPPQTDKRDSWVTKQWKKIFKPKKNDTLKDNVIPQKVKKDSVVVKKTDSVKVVKKKKESEKVKKDTNDKYETRTVNGRKRRYRKGG